MKYPFNLLSISLAATLLASCEYKDFIEKEIQSVNINIDWQGVDSVPRSTRVVFFPDKETMLNTQVAASIAFDVMGNSRFIQLPIGHYDVVAYNNDTEHVEVTDAGVRETMNAVTGIHTTRANFVSQDSRDTLDIGEYQVADYPDYLVQAHYEDFSVMPTDTVPQLYLQADSAVVEVSLEVRGLRSLDFVYQIKGTISNVPATYRIGTGRVAEKPSTVIFNATHDRTTVTASFFLFGTEVEDSKDDTHVVTLFFWMDDGRVYIPIDVTEEVREARRQGTRKIRVSVEQNCDIRENITGSGGFHLHVDDWVDEQIDLQL